MGQYLVRFTALSTLKIPIHATFNLGHSRVVVSDDPFYDTNSTPWTNRVAISVTLPAESMSEAIPKAQYSADSILGLLVTSTSASIDHCQLDRAIEHDEGTHDRRMEQRIPVPIPIPCHRSFEPDVYDQFHQAISNRENHILIENVDRFTRATRWYRKGILEHELFDQYLNFWGALEALKIILNRKYNIPNDLRIEHPCEFCGQGRMIPTEGGILKLIERSGNPHELWRQLREVRNEITHGHVPLNEITPRAQTLLPILQRLVLFGLLEILDISDEDKPKFLREPNYHVGCPVLQINAKIAAVPSDQLNHDQMPRFCYHGSQNPQGNETSFSGRGGLMLESANAYHWIIENAEFETPQDPERPITLQAEITVFNRENLPD